MKLCTVELRQGMLIGMLNGVVRVEDVAQEGDAVYVSIGKLRYHKVATGPFAHWDVVAMPETLRGWYGV